ncbi:MAG: SET domain-containing protein [bacterium]
MRDHRRLSSWLIEAGGWHDPLEIRELRGMRGVVATQPIAAGSVVAEIPRSVLIHAPTALARMAERQMGSGLEDAGEVAQLAAWLLVERRDAGSPFVPYLETLPASFAQFPIQAAPEEVALLDGSLVGAMLEHQRAEIAAEHARLVAEAPWARSIGFDEYLWARIAGPIHAGTTMLTGGYSAGSRSAHINPEKRYAATTGSNPTCIYCCTTGSASMAMTPTRQCWAPRSNSGSCAIAVSHSPS